MRPFIILLVLAASTTIIPDTADARKVCGSTMKVSGSYDTRRGGKADLVRKWQYSVKARYGREYSDWKLAKKKKKSCKKVNLRINRGGSNVPADFVCEVRAQPCIKKTARRTCYGRLTSRKVDESDPQVRDAKNKKKAAKEAAKRNWSVRAENRYGPDFRWWFNARKKKVHCDRFKSGFFLGPPNPGCQVSARPCND